MALTVWTPARKWLGNFVPGCFWLAFASLGLYWIVHTRELIGLGLWVLVFATVVSWMLLNLFGLYDNFAMQKELARILGADTDLPKDRVFVGFSTPKYTGLIDAHEDVGYLCFMKDSLLFAGEMRTVELDRFSITTVRFRPNVHTLLGLGRWIAIDAVANGTPVRMLIEPREKRTMLSNLLYGKQLKAKIEAWKTR